MIGRRYSTDRARTARTGDRTSGDHLPELPMRDLSLARQVCSDLLDVGAVAFASDEPFLWASGLRAPVYCDNRLVISYPDVRRRIRDGFSDVIERERLAADAIVGTATAGIPHAAWLADVLDLPMAYVRSKPKEHGRRSQVEGRIPPDGRVVVVEDLVSTGGSSARVVDALRDEGVQVMAVLAIFSYEFPAADRLFDERRIRLFTLTGFEKLLDVASSRRLLSESDRRSIMEWRRDPDSWSQTHGGTSLG